MYILFAGYKLTPAQVKDWFALRGVELKDTFEGNRYLAKHDFQTRIRSCMYEGKHCFVVVTRGKFIHDYFAIEDKYERFEETDDTRVIKAEMGLEDVEFITTTDYID